jgi:hypothetical protein
MSELRELLYSIQRLKHIEGHVKFSQPKACLRHAANSAKTMVLDIALRTVLHMNVLFAKGLMVSAIMARR